MDAKNIFLTAVSSGGRCSSFLAALLEWEMSPKMPATIE